MSLAVRDMRTMADILEEVSKARRRYPEDADRFAVLLEEVGEVADEFQKHARWNRAALEAGYPENQRRIMSFNARCELVQLAASAFRLLADDTTDPDAGLLEQAVALGESARRLLDGTDIDWESGTDIDWDVD